MIFFNLTYECLFKFEDVFNSCELKSHFLFDTVYICLVFKLAFISPSPWKVSDWLVSSFCEIHYCILVGLLPPWRVWLIDILQFSMILYWYATVLCTWDSYTRVLSIAVGFDVTESGCNLCIFVESMFTVTNLGWIKTESMLSIAKYGFIIFVTDWCPTSVNENEEQKWSLTIDNLRSKILIGKYRIYTYLKFHIIIVHNKISCICLVKACIENECFSKARINCNSFYNKKMG